MLQIVLVFGKAHRGSNQVFVFPLTVCVMVLSNGMQVLVNSTVVVLPNQKSTLMSQWSLLLLCWYKHAIINSFNRYCV